MRWLILSLVVVVCGCSTAALRTVMIPKTSDMVTVDADKRVCMPAAGLELTSASIGGGVAKAVERGRFVECMEKKGYKSTFQSTQDKGSHWWLIDE